VTATTVWGIAAQGGGVAEPRSASGRLLGGHSFDSLDLELGGTEIDLDHTGERAGEIVYVELTTDDQLAVVGVLDDDAIASIAQRVYASASLLLRGDVLRSTYLAREAKVLGLALTFEPALLGARALRSRPGDVRRAPDRAAWPVSWASADPLLGRAVEHARRGGRLTETRSAQRIADRRHQDSGDYPWRAGMHVPFAADDRPPGSLEHSGHRGRVLSVR
jgi:hypothetical protein